MNKMIREVLQRSNADDRIEQEIQTAQESYEVNYYSDRKKERNRL
jgi:hypothetical protein